METVPSPTVLLDDSGHRPRYDASATTTAAVASRAGGAASASSARESFLIAAVAENRAREIGLCAIDLAAPYELLLWSIIDSNLYADTISLLHAYNPVEILVVETSQTRKINEEINKHFAAKAGRVIPIARKYFDQTRGAEDLKRVMANTVDINLGRNYISMAAVSCIMQYVEYVQGITIAPATIKVVVNPSIKKLLMDQATVASLELVHSAGVESGSRGLCDIINSTKTTAGNRLLRSTVRAITADLRFVRTNPHGFDGQILQPSCHLATIKRRQEVVSAFLDNPSFFFDVKELLSDFVDIEHLLSQLVGIPKVITPRISRISISNVIALKHTLERLPKLASCLRLFTSQMDSHVVLLDSITRSLHHDSFPDIRREIERVINERVKFSRSAAQKRIQECFAVRAGIDGMLDVARRAYLDTTEKIYEAVYAYKEELSLPMRLSYTSKRGYHLVIPANITSLPSLFIERVKSSKSISCSTRALISLNLRLNESLTAIYKLSNGVIQELLQQIRPHANALYMMVESIAMLDMMLSFTNVVALAPPDQPYVKPVVSEHGNLVIKRGRHPIVERVLKDIPYTPSDSFFDPLSTFHLITGPNCAGKSTYMRATAMIVIMAQMGSYVPALEAHVPIRDRICTRFGTSDDMEENASSFSVEMTETAAILELCTPRSLVLLDELGRGTANDEGAALAWSISETLIERRCYTCHATHYHDLNRLERMYPNCRCYHFAAAVGQRLLRHGYEIKDGQSESLQKYGIEAARLCGLPREVVDKASDTYERLNQNQAAINGAAVEPQNGGRPLNKKLLHHLYALRYAGLNHSDLRAQLQHLRETYLT